MNFRDKTNLNKRPMKADIKFYQQYSLNFDKYRDNNNFVRHNYVETDDHRFLAWKKPLTFSFIDIYPFEIWHKNRVTITKNVSYDGINFFL